MSITCARGRSRVCILDMLSITRARPDGCEASFCRRRGGTPKAFVLLSFTIAWPCEAAIIAKSALSRYIIDRTINRHTTKSLIPVYKCIYSFTTRSKIRPLCDWTTIWSCDVSQYNILFIIPFQCTKSHWTKLKINKLLTLIHHSTQCHWPCILKWGCCVKMCMLIHILSYKFSFLFFS